MKYLFFVISILFIGCGRSTTYMIEVETFTNDGVHAGHLYHDAVKGGDGDIEKYYIRYPEENAKATGVDSVIITVVPLTRPN